MLIFTMQISTAKRILEAKEKGRFPTLDIIDVTVKSGQGTARLMAPTWNMVKAYKSGTLTEEEYTRLYTFTLGQQKEEILKYISSFKNVALVCYCPAGAFCHRVILAKWLDKHLPKEKEAQYRGEMWENGSIVEWKKEE